MIQFLENLKNLIQTNSLTPSKTKKSKKEKKRKNDFEIKLKQAFIPNTRISNQLNVESKLQRQNEERKGLQKPCFGGGRKILSFSRRRNQSIP
jgi:hypothetical protein